MNDYLLNAKISLFERKFNLEESIGFNPNDYPYQEHWEDMGKSEYESLLSEVSKYPTLVGVLNKRGSGSSYVVTILHHNGSYVTLVKEVNGTDFSVDFSKDYLEALESVQVEALILDICRKDRKGDN